jgi:muconate cycloisomerase
VKIERIDTLIIDLPTVRPHVLSMATLYRQTATLVRIVCSDGVEGIGEGTTIGGLSYGAESPEGMKLVIDTYMAPILFDSDPTRVAQTMARIRRLVVGNHFARNAVETALLDAQGKRCNLPVSELLGGRVRERVPVLWTLASGDTAADIAEAEEMLDRGRHDTFKLKIGKRSIEDDVGHAAAIKHSLGDRASVRVDLNQAWSETAARRGLEMLADAGIDLVEQPISRHNRAGMARLVARSRVPIMADEALQGPQDAFDFARDHGADVFAVKIAQSGGLFAATRVSAIAEAAGIALYGGTMLEAGIGTIASAHVFATFPQLDFGTELFGPLLLTEEILTEQLDYSNFALTVPGGPGLGIVLDADRVEFFRRDRTSTSVAGSLETRAAGV